MHITRSKFFKRITSGVLTLAVTITALLGGVNIDLLKAEAASARITAVSTGLSGYYRFNGLYSYSAFCLDQYKHAWTPDGYATTTSYEATPAQQRAICWIGYYGYPNGGTNNNYFNASQALIWEIMQGLRNPNTFKLTGAGKMNSYYAAYNTYKTIETQIQAKQITPQFAGSSDLTLKWNSSTGLYEGSLVDNNGVVSQFNLATKIDNDSRFTATRTGNTIKVTAKNPVTSYVTFVSDQIINPASANETYKEWYCYDQTGNPYATGLAYKQRLAYGSRPDPLQASVRIMTENTKDVKITKKFTNVSGNEYTATTQYMSNLAALFNNTEFVLKNSNGDYIRFSRTTSGNINIYTYLGTATTSTSTNGTILKAQAPAPINGVGHGTNYFTLRNLPRGQYTLIETKTPDGFTKANEVTIAVADTAKTITNKEKNNRIIEIDKSWRMVDGSTFGYDDMIDKFVIFDQMSIPAARALVDDLYKHIYFTAYVVPASEVPAADHDNTTKLKNATKYYITSTIPAFTSVDHAYKIPSSGTYMYLGNNDESDAYHFVPARGYYNQSKVFIQDDTFAEPGIRISGLTNYIYDGTNTGIKTNGYIYFTEHYNYDLDGDGVDDIPKQLLDFTFEPNYDATSDRVYKIHMRYDASNEMHVGNTYNYERGIKISLYKTNKSISTEGNNFKLQGADYQTGVLSSGRSLAGAKYYLLERLLDSADKFEYADSGRKYNIIAEGVTNSQGMIDFGDQYFGISKRYYVKEISAPKGWEIDYEYHEIDLRSSTYSLIPEMVNRYKKTSSNFRNNTTYARDAAVWLAHSSAGSPPRFSMKLMTVPSYEKPDTKNITIYKKDHHEKNIEGIQFVVKNTTPVTEYTTARPNGVNYAVGEYTKTGITSADGMIQWTGLPYGDYQVYEVTEQSPWIPLGDPIPVDFTSKSEDTETMTIINNPQRAQITIHKKDGNTQEELTGAEFEIYPKNDVIINGEVEQIAGTVLGTLTTSNGEVTNINEAGFEVPLYVGATYIIKEVTAPNGYVLDPTEHEITPEWANEAGLELNLEAVPEEITTYYNSQPKTAIAKKEWVTTTDRFTNTSGNLTTVTRNQLQSQIYFTAKIGIPNNDPSLGDDVIYKYLHQPKYLETVTDANGLQYAVYDAGYYNTESKTVTYPDPANPGNPISQTFIALGEPVDGSLTLTEPAPDNDGYCLLLPKNTRGIILRNLPESCVNVIFEEHYVETATAATQLNNKRSDMGLSTSLVTMTQAIDNGALSFIAAPTTVTAATVDQTDDIRNAVASSTAYKTFMASAENAKLTNTEQTDLKIFLYKIGRRTDGTTVETPLAGATYELSVKNAIEIDGVQYTAGQGLQTKTSVLKTVGSETKAVIEFDPIDPKFTQAVLRVHETQEPAGYKRNTSYITLNTGSAHYDAAIGYTKIEQTVYDDDITVPVRIVKKVQGVSNTTIEAPVQGAKFNLYADADVFYADGTKAYSKDELIEELTTDITGNAVSTKRLPLGGKFRVEEAEVPDGVVLSSDKTTFTIPSTYTGTEYNVPTILDKSQYGQLHVYKYDPNLEGEQALQGAKFKLMAAENIYDVDETTLLWASGATIEGGSGECVTDTSGNITFTTKLPIVKLSNSHLYQYKIVEVEAPLNVETNTPYQIKAPYDTFEHSPAFNFTPDGTVDIEYVETTKSVTNGKTMGNIKIYKRDSQNHDIKLRNAKFSIYVSDNRGPVKYKGNIYNEGEYLLNPSTGLDYFVTDTNGEILIEGLPLGRSYFVTEIEAPAGYNKASDSTINLITEEQADAQGLSYVLEERTFYESQGLVDVKAVKTGMNNVKLEGAEFTLVSTKAIHLTNGTTIAANTPIVFDSQGKPKAKTDADENLKTNANGEITFPALPVADYISGTFYTFKLTEVKPPKGYKLSSSPTKSFTLKNNFTATYSNTPTHLSKSYTFNNAPIKVAFLKTDNLGTAIAGAKLRVEKAGGSGIYIPTWTTTTTPKLVNEFIAGTYKLVEVKAPNGYAIASPITFTVSETGAVEITNGTGTIQQMTISGESSKVITLTMPDEKLNVKIAKYALTAAGAKTTTFVSDAVLQILDPSNRNAVVEEWTTTSELHQVEAALEGGHTYVLHEKTTPDGYVQAEDQTFVAPTSGEAFVKAMYDKPTHASIEKYTILTNGTRQILGNAKLRIIEKSTGTVVETWTSTANKRHDITAKLKVGATYILRETAAPSGYEKAADKEFTVPANGECGIIEMEDWKAVRIAKYVKRADGTNSTIFVPGAVLAIYDGSAEIERWTTTTGLHKVTKKLTAGKTYTLKEIRTPAGYVKAADQTFTAPYSGVAQTVAMYDQETRASIEKYTVVGTGASQHDEILPGAVMQILDANKQPIADVPSWTSTSSMHNIDGLLETGKTYWLREISAPEGYVKAADQQFTMPANGKVTVRMRNNLTETEISKRAIVGGTPSTSELPGATLELYDMEVNPLETGYLVETWETSDESHIVKGLKYDHVYMLNEGEAPEGYQLAQPIKFKILENGSVQILNFETETPKETADKVIMYDSQGTNIQIVKVDAETGEPLADAVLELYAPDGTFIRRWTTSADEPEVFEHLMPGKYTIKEIKAPRGYNTGAEMEIEVTPSTSNIPVEFEYPNNKGILMPETGGTGTTILIVAGIACLIIAAGIFFFFTKKKKR